MSEITKDMIIMDVLMLDREAAPIFMKHGMYCVGCPSASGKVLRKPVKFMALTLKNYWKI